VGVCVSIALYTRFYQYSAYDADILTLGPFKDIGVLMLDLPEEEVFIATPKSDVQEHDELFTTAEFADIIGYLEDCKREIENRDNYYDPKQIAYIEGIVARLDRLYGLLSVHGNTYLMRRIQHDNR